MPFSITSCVVALRMFLHLGWGGFYSDAEADSAQIRECFHLADKIVDLAHATELAGGWTTDCCRVGFLCGYYEPLRASMERGVEPEWELKPPAKVLSQEFEWLMTARD